MAGAWNARVGFANRPEWRKDERKRNYRVKPVLLILLIPAVQETKNAEKSARNTATGTTVADSGVVYEKSNTEKTANAASTGKTQYANPDLVAKLKADAEARTSQLQNIVTQMLSKQGVLLQKQMYVVHSGQRQLYRRSLLPKPRLRQISPMTAIGASIRPLIVLLILPRLWQEMIPISWRKCAPLLKRDTNRQKRPGVANFPISVRKLMTLS